VRSAGAIALALVAGFGVVRLLLLAAPDLLRAPALQTENFRGKRIPTAGGLLVVLAVLIIEGARVGLGAVGVGRRPGLDAARALVLLAVLGFGVLGLLDDVLATGEERGFGGHGRALLQGRVTTGLLKLVGGGALALALAAAPGPEGRLHVIADAALIALAANLGNLLDRAPGRALKCGVVAWIPLLFVAGGDGLGLALAAVMGAFVATAPEDLGEQLMLGDAGANVLGAVLGLAVVLEVGWHARLVVLAVVLALNLVSEWVSFSRVIERVGVLRALDGVGRRR
jgi:UDP-N-acetylmuramyl pentapeptide phosphotransferase/UDP-N-acetylglucosamine-1-phosphate transferase